MKEVRSRMTARGRIATTTVSKKERGRQISKQQAMKRNSGLRTKRIRKRDMGWRSFEFTKGQHQLARIFVVFTTIGGLPASVHGASLSQGCEIHGARTAYSDVLAKYKGNDKLANHSCLKRSELAISTSQTTKCPIKSYSPTRPVYQPDCPSSNSFRNLPSASPAFLRPSCRTLHHRAS